MCLSGTRQSQEESCTRQVVDKRVSLAQHFTAILFSDKSPPNLSVGS